MNKKQKYEQLCWIRNLLLIIAVVLAFSVVTVGVLCFGKPGTTGHGETEPSEVTVEPETTYVHEETEGLADTKETTGVVTEETLEPDDTTGSEFQEENHNETIQETASMAETETLVNDGDSVAESTALEDILNSILHEEPHMCIEKMEILAQVLIPDDTDDWEMGANGYADIWFEELTAFEGGVQEQLISNWKLVCENWGDADTHSGQAERLYVFLNEFFDAKELLWDGGGQE